MITKIKLRIDLREPAEYIFKISRRLEQIPTVEADLKAFCFLN